MNDLRAFSYEPLIQDPFVEERRGGEMVIFDLEFTAWEGSQERDWSEPWETREIIQIGAIRVKDDAALTEVDRFLCYVSPTQNSELSDYITKLTGIDQETLDTEGFAFDEAFDVFMAFCDGARAILSYSGDPEVVAENCRINGIAEPDWPRFGNIQPVLGNRAGRPFAETSSCYLPSLVGLETEGREHDALDDADAIITTLRVLRTRGLV